ncbi:MAG: carbon-nitrogen hydrolase family protein [Bacillota bacterium]|nr:carbon-nitrogen hydrolase family protein [Bacillota bacterium]
MPFRIVERKFSENENLPTVLLANIYGSPSVQCNLDKMDKIIEIAHNKNVNIVVFPELSVTGYIWNTKHQEQITDLLAEGENNRIRSWLKNVRNSLHSNANRLEYIIYGNVRKRLNSYFNCVFILCPEFDYRSEDKIYAKVFLTPIEKTYFRQGTDKRLSIDTRWGKFGFLVCYDLCYVELPRQYAFIDNVDAIVTIAAWRSQAIREYSNMNIRTDHYYGFLWDLMNSSKAAYNQVWSLGINWVGRHQKGKEYFWGGSGIWAPSGMKLLQASNINEELLIIRNVDIKEQSIKEKDDFNYRIDFEHFYRNLVYKD